MRISIFFNLMLASLCVSLLAFALVEGVGLMGALKLFAFSTVASIAITAFYPGIRGIKAGDTVSVVNSSNIPSLIGRAGTAESAGRLNQQIKISLDNGNEVMGVIESYIGIISPPKVRIIYEEKLVE